MEQKKKNVMKAYFIWPYYLGLLFVLAAAAAFYVNKKLGLSILLLGGAYYMVLIALNILMRRRVRRKLVEFGASYAQAQNELLRQVEIPFAMCDQEGSLIWENAAFQKTFFGKKKETALWRLFPELNNARFDKNREYHVSFEEGRYTLNISGLQMEGMEPLTELSDSQEDFRLYNVYLIDETDLLHYKDTLEREKAVLALVYFDNYEEVMADVEYVRRSLLSALLERKLNKSVTEFGGVIRKLEKDRFFLIMKQESLWTLQEKKFPLLEDIKAVNIGNDMAMTISMGVGLGGSTLEQNYDYARAAIDMALGRGGDQVVIKEGADIRYFGGKAQTKERNTRVKARIKAHALRELVEAADTVMIMGHPISDLDCIGAAMGIYRAAKFSGKRAYVVTETPNSSVQPVLNAFRNNSEYESELFITGERAMELMNKETVLVVVDTNRPSYTECPGLLKKARSVVVMDHHRQGREQIENALLSYVEPYASSASEMVAEVVQYYDDALRLRPAEADAVFAGIVMDTNNFADKSGVRTFEAAAFLRRCGADVTRVRKLFRESEEDYKLKAETIQQAEIFEKDYIIGICPQKGSLNQTVIAAQAANELLEIRGVKASFVLTEFEEKVYISARSIDEVNVQVIMEKLGGGGHQSVAGAQFTDITLSEALERLKSVITEQN